MAERFLNPYNFIPLPEHKAKAYEDQDKHTGVIEYTITTRSPLFIPNTSENITGDEVSDAFGLMIEDHASYDFYSYTEIEKGKNYTNDPQEPVIPGSELRGMLRNVYETLTDSCMSVLNEGTFPAIRVRDAYKPSLLKKNADGTYSLVAAEDLLHTVRKGKGDKTKTYEVEKRLEGTKVGYKKVRQSNGKWIVEIHDHKGNEPAGYLIKGMSDSSLNRKHYCHVFAPKNSTISQLSSKDIDRLKGVIDAYQEESGGENAYKEYQKQLELFLKGNKVEFFPVYYNSLTKNNVTKLYLAPACFTKEVSNYSLEDLAGDFVACKNLQDNCPACDLFGMTGSDNEQATASKVRFEDARVTKVKANGEYYDPIITLETLANPKIKTVEFYLEQPGKADYWNYDYYVQNGELHFAQGKIRGRKYYWHQRDKVLRKDVEKTKFNKTIRPVKSGNVFTGKMYFDKISEKQLNQLIWILNGGCDSEQPTTGPIAYKLGSGKPLGLGSVELKVTKVVERQIALKEDSISYDLFERDLTIPTYEEVGFNEKIKDDFFTISSLDATNGLLVTYPIVQGQEDKPMAEGFKWFGVNHGTGMKRDKLKRDYVLPRIKDVATLPILVARDNGGNDGNGGRNGQQRCNQNGYQGRPQGGQQQGNAQRPIIDATLIGDAELGKKGDCYIGRIIYDGRSLIVFDVPKTLKKGAKIRVEIRSNDKGVTGRYKG